MRYDNKSKNIIKNKKSEEHNTYAIYRIKDKDYGKHEKHRKAIRRIKRAKIIEKSK